MILCSSISDSRPSEAAGYGDFLWISPLSSPRSDGYVSVDEAAGIMRSSSELLGHAPLRASFGSSAADGCHGGNFCRRDSGMSTLQQHVRFGGRNLGRQLSDSVLPEVCSDDQCV